MEKVSAIALDLAGVARAAVARIDALFDGHADPGQRDSEQNITDRKKYG
jgi:hypothetical protein